MLFPKSKQPSKNNMSYAKTRTTYRPCTHPKSKNNACANVEISIQVFPAPTYEELCAMRAMCDTSDEGHDQTAWKQALDMEVYRCRALPAWSMKQQETPTQHARIDPAQTEQLKDLLKPETLRRRFISMPALIAKIQADVQNKTS